MIKVYTSSGGDTLGKMSVNEKGLWPLDDKRYIEITSVEDKEAYRAFVGDGYIEVVSPRGDKGVLAYDRDTTLTHLNLPYTFSQLFQPFRNLAKTDRLSVSTRDKDHPFVKYLQEQGLPLGFTDLPHPMYKYRLVIDNHQDRLESLLCESYIFYLSSNLEDKKINDPSIGLVLEGDNYELFLEKIVTSIAHGVWSDNLSYIQMEKENILHHHNITEKIAQTVRMISSLSSQT